MSRLSGEFSELCADLRWQVRFADGCGIDPVAAAEQKIERNEARFPPLP